MNLKLMAGLTLALLAQTCLAEEQVISVPGEGWRIRFDAPKLTPVDSPLKSVYFGHADRLVLSFFVEPPKCPGGDSDENIYACYTATLQKNPAVDWDTERGNTVPNGVQVMYMSSIEAGGQKAKAFNINLLFARKGKWADLHVSIAGPTRDDVKALFALIQSVKAEDE